MREVNESLRRSKLQVRNPGGTAGPNGKQYRICLPTKWINAMGISPEERSVTLSFDGNEITIRKSETQE